MNKKLEIVLKVADNVASKYLNTKMYIQESLKEKS